MAEDFEITGKKKLLIDDGGYYHVKRLKDSFHKPDPILGETLHQGLYYNTTDATDKVRIVAGTNWDYQIYEDKPFMKPKFSNWWGWVWQVESFAESPVTLEVCGPLTSSIYTPPGALDQEILLKAHYEPPVITAANDTLLGMRLSYTGKAWGAYIKTGLNDKPPIVKANHEFFDHYHETFVPFTPDELIKKQPTGKAYFADYKTYYNERLDSIPFEQAVGQRPELQNSLPSIYGFLRLAKNSLLLEDGNFELTKLIDYIRPYRWYDKSMTRKQVYNDLFQKYPLETSTFLYAMINNHRTDELSDKMYWLDAEDTYNNQMVERIINLDYTKFDASALFEEYFDTYANLIITHTNHKRLAYNNGKLNKVKALERIMSNVVFSPNFIPIMDKVDQYKKYFPYYVDLRFTAKRLTTLGDLMKDLFMTRYLSYKVAASKLGKGLSDWAQYTYGITSPWCPSPSGLDNNCDAGLKFVEFTNEKIYTDTTGKQLDYNESSLSDLKQKRSFDLQAVIKEFADPATIIESHKNAAGSVDNYDNSNDFYRDIRNYVTFVRDDFKDPVKLIDDDNTVFKTLCGKAFQLKIMNLYNTHRRSYMDIMNGVPAYTEDLFYRIEKQRKMKPTESNPNPEWKTVQSILIPNTSDLDIARYVDTQLKYSAFATYRYNVYTMRVVFGSKYKYLWGKSTDQGFIPNESQTFGVTTSPQSAATEGAWIEGHNMWNPDTKAFEWVPGYYDSPPDNDAGTLSFPEGAEILDGLQNNALAYEVDEEGYTIPGKWDPDDMPTDPNDVIVTRGNKRLRWPPVFGGSSKFEHHLMLIDENGSLATEFGPPGYGLEETLLTAIANNAMDTIVSSSVDAWTEYYCRQSGAGYNNQHPDAPVWGDNYYGCKTGVQVTDLEELEHDPGTPGTWIEAVDVPPTYKLMYPPQNPPGSGKYLYTAKFLVRVEPSIRVIEDKLFSTPEVFIMDRPPMPPDIDIIPYRAVNNKLKFILNGTTGRAKEKPIIMLESDKEKFDLVARAQLVPQFDDDGEPLPLQPVEFANDDPVLKFQIFRVKDHKPVLFEDFELYKDAIGSVFEETILPNTKYYYTFRSIDDHDHISNPSPVYEVELIDEKGAVKPMIRLVSMDPVVPKSLTKECQKYIYIKPSIKQLYFSEDEEVDGIFSSPLKKKKYKLRLTSKGSGKKIDINFSFEKTNGSL